MVDLDFQGFLLAIWRKSVDSRIGGEADSDWLNTDSWKLGIISTVRAIPVSSPPPKCGILDPKWQFKSCSIYYKTHLHSTGKIPNTPTTLGKFPPFSSVQKPGTSERNVSCRNSISMLAETRIEADELDSINTLLMEEILHQLIW